MKTYLKDEDLEEELEKVWMSTFTLSNIAHRIFEKYGNTSEYKEINTSIAELEEFLGHNSDDSDKAMHFAKSSECYLKSDDYYVHLFKARETAINALRWAHYDRDKKIAKHILQIVDLRMKAGYNNTNILYDSDACAFHKNTLKYTANNKADKFYKILQDYGDDCISPWTYDTVWSLPNNDKYGQWMPVIKGPLLHEYNGYHLCNGIDGFRDWIEWQGFDLGSKSRVFEAEITGEYIICGGEIIVRTCRLIKETKWDYETSLKISKRCKMNNDIEKQNKILDNYLNNGNVWEIDND